jgi:hypothetical protein
MSFKNTIISDLLFRKSGKTNSISKVTTFLAVIVLSVASLSSLSVSAQSQQNRGIIVSPAIIEQEADKNIPYDLNVNIQNDSTEDNVNFTPVLYEFNSVNEDGTPNIKPVDPTSERASWISFADTAITLNKGEKKDAKVRVLVSDDAQAGSYYFALTFSRQAQESDDQGKLVSINSQIASLLFLTVKGQVNREVQLNDIKLSSSVVDPFFDPLNISYKVSLNGNAYVKPAGNIFTGNDLTNPDNTLTINPNQRIILPNSSRTFETRINPSLDYGKGDDNMAGNGDLSIVDSYNRPFFGSQKISLKMIYVNNDGKLDQKTAELDVWFIPWRFMIALAVVLALGFGVFFYIKKSKKSEVKS